MNNNDFGNILSLLTENPDTIKLILNLIGNLQKSNTNSSSNNLSNTSNGIGNILNMLVQDNKKESSPKNDLVSNVFGDKEERNKRIGLLNALKPYLSTERCDKIDIIIRILKLSELGELPLVLGKI